MQSRRDQVDAHGYLLTRLTSALVRAEPDALELPTRRDTRGVLGGTLLALAMLLGVAAWALLFSGGSTAWRQPGKLIIDKSTGSRYLLAGGELRPVRNIASAQLAYDGPLDLVSVASSRLAGVPRGAPLGTAEAPDLLPAAKKLNAGVWRACAAPVPAAAAGSSTPLRIDIGAPPAPADRRMTGDEAVLVSSAGRQYLLWRGQRLALDRPWAADVLGYGGAVVTPVDPGWLALVPAGPALTPVDVPGRGGPGPGVGGRPATLGQLFAARGADGRTVHYLLLPAGLTPLNATQAALALGEAGDTAETPVSPAELAAGPRGTVPAAQAALPAAPPPLRTPAHGEAVCLETAGRPDAETLAVVLATPPSAPGTPAAGGVGVSVRPGGGALLVGRTDVAAKDQPLLLIDGAGIRYPLDGDAPKALGVTADQASVVPARLLALLPAGPRLYTPERR